MNEAGNGSVLPKEYFEVLWQLSATCIAGVHCDEDANCGCEPYVLSHKVKCFFLIANGILRK